MWVLQNEKNECKYFLPCNKTITIGRKDVDIVISGDSSVSRKHATIYICISMTDVNKLDAHGKVVLTDASKFGTYLVRGQANKKKAETGIELQNGDVIEFGVQGSIFKLFHEHFNVAVSTIDDGLKSELQEALVVIGGNMINGWHHDVDYLVVKTIKLNLKVVKALVTPCHIVTSEFVLNIRDQVLNQLGQVLFEPAKYLPMFDEPTLSPKTCNFYVDLSRRKIFSGKTFIFLTKKQQEKMGPIIVAAGGEVMLLANNAAIIDAFAIIKVDACFVTCDSSSVETCDLTRARLMKVDEFVKAADKRVIEEYEIALSVLYCDISVYCNPEFDLNTENVLTQRLHLHSPREIWSLGKESCSFAKSEVLEGNSRIPDRLNEQQLEILSNSPTLSDHETEAVRNSLKFAGHWLDISEPSNESVSVKDDFKAASTMLPFEVKDISRPTLGNGTHLESSECRPSSGEKNGARVATGEESPLSLQSVTNVLSNAVVDAAVRAPPEKVRFCLVKKKLSDQEAKQEPNNFKRFRKTWPTYIGNRTPQDSFETCPRLPKVIGGNDFFVSCGHDESISRGESKKEQQDTNPFRRQ